LKIKKKCNSINLPDCKTGRSNRNESWL